MFEGFEQKLNHKWIRNIGKAGNNDFHTVTMADTHFAQVQRTLMWRHKDMGKKKHLKITRVVPGWRGVIKHWRPRRDSPVFNVEESWVILVVVLFIKRGHLHSLSRSGYYIILPSFPDSSSRSDHFDHQAGDQRQRQAADHNNNVFQSWEMRHDGWNAGSHRSVCHVMGQCVLAPDGWCRVDLRGGWRSY